LILFATGISMWGPRPFAFEHTDLQPKGEDFESGAR
jgi:hypothetical protein